VLRRIQATGKTPPPPVKKKGARGAKTAKAAAGKKAKPAAVADWSQVSDLVWQSWGATIKASGLGSELLGRVALALNEVPTVIWDKKLLEYCGVPISDLRSRRTHGEKRVQAIVGALQSAQTLITAAAGGTKLTRLRLPLFEQLEQWSNREWTRAKSPTYEWVAASFLEPQLKQLAKDLPELTYSVLIDRLGWHCTPKSVLQISLELDLTRARVYQHLEMIAKVMKLRWPEGEAIWNKWNERLREAAGWTVTPASGPRFSYYMATQLFYPADEA